MIKSRFRAVIASGLVFIAAAATSAAGQSLDIPSKKWGLSLGNSREFTGLRFNFRDSRVRRITGINVTQWQPRKDNKDALVAGISLGTIAIGIVNYAYRVKGAQIGLVNIVRSNPRYLRILPNFNSSF